MIGAERALNVLLELTGKLDAERSLTSSLQHLTDVALELLPGDHISLRLLDRSRRELLPAARSFSGSGAETGSPPHPLRVEVAAPDVGEARKTGPLETRPKKIATSEASRSEAGQSEAGQSDAGSSEARQSKAGRPETGSSEVRPSKEQPSDEAAARTAPRQMAPTNAETRADGSNDGDADGDKARVQQAESAEGDAEPTSSQTRSQATKSTYETASDASAWGVPSVVEQAGEGFAQGVAGWVVARGEAARIADAYLDQRFVVQPNQGFVIRSMLAVPLWSAGEVVGVLAATSKQPAIYQQQHEKLACLLASCAVPRIEKARRAKLAESAAQVLDHTILAAELHSQMNQAYASGSSLSLLLIGLDNFKQVNDKYSRRAGDKILAAVGSIVRESTRLRDVVVRRRSDEFAVVMPATSKENGTAAAERIRALIEFNSITLPSGAEVRLTTSIGVATWDGDEPPQQLETRSEEALLAAKRHGRNRIHFDYSYNPLRDRRGASDDGYPIYDELTASDDAFEITDEATVTDDGD